MHKHLKMESYFVLVLAKFFGSSPLINLKFGQIPDLHISGVLKSMSVVVKAKTREHDMSQTSHHRIYLMQESRKNLCHKL